MRELQYAEPGQVRSRHDYAGGTSRDSPSLFPLDFRSTCRAVYGLTDIRTPELTNYKDVISLICPARPVEKVRERVANDRDMCR